MSTDPDQPAPGPPAAPEPVGATEASDATPAGASAPGRSRARWVISGAAALVVLVVSGVVAVAVLRSGRTPTTYKAVENLCTVVDLAPLAEVYPTESRRHHVRTATEMGCHIPVRSDSAAGFFGMDLTLLPDAAGAKQKFESTRAQHQSSGPLTDVSELGTAAYWHMEQGLGTDLIAYDGNLYVHAWAGDLRNPANAVPGAAERLATISRETMRKLEA